MKQTRRPEFVVHSGVRLDGIRKAATVASYVRDELPLLCRPGMSTKAVDELAGAMISGRGGRSAFLGYRGFPGNICISLNDEVVHGIGLDDRILKSGDIVSIDIGVVLDGFIGDTATTFVLDAPESPPVQHLLENTRKALSAGIAAAMAGRFVRDISAAVEKVAKAARLGIVQEYVGHGCGVDLHEPPEVPNFVTSNRGPMLRPGMVLCIEPMLNLGGHRVFTGDDRWTVRTRDGSASAHFEHMVAITETEPEVLTWTTTAKKM